MERMTAASVNKSSSVSARSAAQIHAGSQVRSTILVRGAIVASLALGVGLLIAPVIQGLLEQRKLLRRPQGHVVKVPFAIEVEPESAYD